MLFTKLQPNGQYSYIDEFAFDINIRTDSDIKALCRNATTKQSKTQFKKALPSYFFFSNIENTLFIHNNTNMYGLLSTPNDVVDCGNIVFSGLACVDIDRLNENDIKAIKGYCCKDNHIKYCATSASGKGCFILYDVGVDNQVDRNFIKELNNDFQCRIYNILHKRDFIVDQITSSIFCCRFESFDPEPYNNFGGINE